MNMRIVCKEIFAAHISEDGRIQTVIEHLEGTANKAREYADSFDAGDNAYLCGLMHDIGKYSEAFQKRIYGGKHRVDHSTAGAYELSHRFGEGGRLLAYCVAGHHAGLPDYGSSADSEEEPTLTGKLRRDLEPYGHFANDLSIPETATAEAVFGRLYRNGTVHVHPDALFLPGRRGTFWIPKRSCGTANASLPMMTLVS